jgi:hypothetical protein
MITTDADFETTGPVTEPLSPTYHIIMTAEEAQAWLPVGAVIADCNGGFPKTRAPREDGVFDGEWQDSYKDDPKRLLPGRYRVLFIPITPPPTVRVGDRVHTAADISRLPSRTILMDSTGTAIQLWHDAEDDSRLWHSAEESRPVSDIELATMLGGYTVIWLPALAPVTGPAGWLVAETSCPGGC